MKLTFAKILFFASYVFTTMYAASTHAITLSQQPLFLSSGAEPNIVFAMDDSASMQFEMIPEELRQGSGNTGNATFVYPLTSDIGPWSGNKGHNGRAAAPGSKSVFGRLMRSKNNKIYYDPAKYYQPWLEINTNGVVVSMPQANFNAALRSPKKPTAGTQNLTAQIGLTKQTTEWLVCGAQNSCSTNKENITFYAASYYWYTGGTREADKWINSNYTLVEIKSGNAPFTGHGRTPTTRPDCTVLNGVSRCTFAEESQNFANWYQYYRNRAAVAVGGITRGFIDQKDNIRLGWGDINDSGNTVDGVSARTVRQGVRRLTLEHKINFNNWLYTLVMDGGTPLVPALQGIGQYYERKDKRSPWSSAPESTNSTELVTQHIACRSSYAIMMTDGYWTTNGVTNIGNADNTDGSTITNDIPQGTPATYKYVAASPYSDTHSNTLADVAMTYWKKDLREDIPNKVRPTELNPAFWQHMTTYAIGLGVTGKLNLDSVESIIRNNTPVDWSSLSLNNSSEIPDKVDDLIHAAINGRGNYFSAAEPDTFATEISNLLSDINKRESNNAAAAAANSTSLNTGSMMYSALFNSTNWSGSLHAYEIGNNGAIGSRVWSASVPQADRRSIYTYNGKQGIEFLWDQLELPQKRLLLKTNEGEAAGRARVDWLRGIDNKVVGDPYDLRDRDGRLIGDIVNSAPVFAANTDYGYAGLPVSLGGGSEYRDYLAEKKERLEVIYVGANDGMLHAFSNKSQGALTAGEEIFAYVPTNGFKKFINLASELYGADNQKPHEYIVDGPSYVADAFIKTSAAGTAQWRNLLVGTLGAGGRGLYVLDITNPESFSESDVLLELTEVDYPELGNITGSAVVSLGKDDRWKIYIGNGYNSSQSGEKAYLGIIDIEDEIIRKRTTSTGGNIAAPTVRTRFIATNTAIENGLAQPALLPDANGRVTTAYAGDLKGNLWKFDLSSTSSSAWGLGLSGKALYVAKDGTNAQPITASPTLGLNPKLPTAGVMVYFGTGQYLTVTDNQPSNITQTFYAIADTNVVVEKTQLHQKTLTTTESKRTINGEYTANGYAVDWSTKKGWYMNFGANERVNTKPLLLYDRIIFATIIPSNDACESGGSGWLMELIAVGNTNLSYRVLGDLGNTFQNVAIFGQLTSLEGSHNRNTSNTSNSSESSASSSAPSNDCGAGGGSGSTGTIAIIGIKSDGTQMSGTGGKPCELFNRQSWRELE